MAIDRSLTPYSINSYDTTVSGVNATIKNKDISGVDTLDVSKDPNHPSYIPNLEEQQVVESQRLAEQELEKQSLDITKITDPTQTIV